MQGKLCHLVSQKPIIRMFNYQQYSSTWTTCSFGCFNLCFYTGPLIFSTHDQCA